LRNKAVLQLTYLAGLRAKEVSLLRWEHLLNEDCEIGEAITLTNDITKGKSGGTIPLNDTLRATLSALLTQDEVARKDRKSAVIKSERGQAFKTQSIVNLLWQHYRKCDIQGASSHSGRRTFITNAARKISLAGGSMRDIQQLARHSNLQITQRYVEANSAAQKAVVNML
jgi:integrase